MSEMRQRERNQKNEKKGEIRKRVSMLAPGELTSLQKNFAWPTVVLFLSALSSWFLVGYLGFTGQVSAFVTVPVQAFLTFALFTPAHDSAHSSVGKGKLKLVNEVIGRCYALLNLAPFPAFRYLHLQHHKHTNTPEDPDIWSSGGSLPRFCLPLFWLTQDFHYYIVYLTAALKGKRPLMEVFESVFTLVAMYTLAFHLLSSVYWKETVLFWLLPVRLATGCLAYGFDYIPHRPHDSPDPYHGTAKIDGLFTKGDVNLDYVLLYQTFHNIHHLYPQIPFYQYPSVWNKYSKVLIDLGTPVKRVF